MRWCWLGGVGIADEGRLIMRNVTRPVNTCRLDGRSVDTAEGPPHFILLDGVPNIGCVLSYLEEEGDDLGAQGLSWKLA
jgi:hypothetical protein